MMTSPLSSLLVRYVIFRIPQIQTLISIIFPVKASKDLFDISHYVQLGQNKLCFTQVDSMVEYILVIFCHYPTQSQIALLHAHWDERKHFWEQLAWLACPISP